MQEQFLNSWQNMLDRLTSWLDLAITNLPNFVIAIFAFTVSYWLSRKMQYLLSKPLSKIIKQTSIHYLITNIAASLVVLLGLFLALGILNLDTVLQSLLAGAGVAGLAIGLALKDSLSNTFSGVVLAIKDIINIGDYIESNGYAGVVEEITLRSTTIRESDNNMVIIPNDTVLSNPFKNYALTNRMKITIKCRVDYQTNLREAKSIAIQAIEQHFKQEEGEKVEFHYLEFKKTAIEFQIRFWVQAVDRTDFYNKNSEAIIVIRETFADNQINIPLPAQNIQLKNIGTYKDNENTNIPITQNGQEILSQNNLLQ